MNAPLWRIKNRSLCLNFVYKTFWPSNCRKEICESNVYAETAYIVEQWCIWFKIAITFGPVV